MYELPATHIYTPLKIHKYPLKYNISFIANVIMTIGTSLDQKKAMGFKHGDTWLHIGVNSLTRFEIYEVLKVASYT